MYLRAVLCTRAILSPRAILYACAIKTATQPKYDFCYIIMTKKQKIKNKQSLVFKYLNK